jgi:Nucleotidyl transferase AbiEii toxin, Type IV TA system
MSVCSAGSSAMSEASPEAALGQVAEELRRRRRSFALVGGLGVSIRGEVRFTRDVDLAIVASTDAETEALVRELGAVGYAVIAIVEHDERKRLATVRLRSPSGIVVDLLAASSGVEREVVERAEPVAIEGAGTIPVARAEELLVMKVLSATDARPQDRMDAISLILINTGLDIHAVRELLARVVERGFHRGQDLGDKLDAFLESARVQASG